jgi:glyoxylate utilization-related uncharacterized protein
MKKVLFLLLFTFIIFVNKKANAQLKGIYYQAVAITEKGNQIAGKDINGLAIHNKAISVRFSVLKGEPEGDILYQEIHQTETDPTGLFSLIIGQGEVTNAGQFNELYKIDWSTIDHFLKVEIDLNNEANFKLMSVQQFMAVPYAYYAEKAKQIDGSNDTSITNELQMLSISNDTIYLTNGGFIKLPPSASVSWNNITNLPGSIDSIINNQYQIDYSNVTNTPNIPTNTSQLNNDAGFISTEVDGSITNELQTLSISNDTIYLSNGGFVKLPPNASVSWNNITNLPSSIDSIINNQYQIDYSNVNNTPNIPTNTSQLNNDAGFITNEVDGSITNELQTLSISNDTIYLTNGGFVKLPPNASVSWNNITNIPGSIDSIINNQYQISYNNLTNVPTIPTNVSQLTNDVNYLTTEIDGSITNEIQMLSINNDTIYLSNGGFIKLPNGFSGSYNDLTNKPTIPTNTSDLTNNSGFITSEVDGSLTNELQTISIINDSLSISNGNKIPINQLSASSGGAHMEVYTAGTYSWTVPAGIKSVVVEMWGAGGGGGVGGYTKCAGAGGGGGYGKGPVTVTPGSIIIITVGAGGAGCTEPDYSAGCSGSNGGNTSFGNLMVAYGGNGAIGLCCSNTGNGNGGSCNALLNCTATANVPCMSFMGITYGKGGNGACTTSGIPVSSSAGTDGYLILIY